MSDDQSLGQGEPLRPTNTVAPCLVGMVAQAGQGLCGPGLPEQRTGSSPALASKAGRQSGLQLPLGCRVLHSGRLPGEKDGFYLWGGGLRGQTMAWCGSILSVRGAAGS
jgi:hypothetical protein